MVGFMGYIICVLACNFLIFHPQGVPWESKYIRFLVLGVFVCSFGEAEKFCSGLKEGLSARGSSGPSRDPMAS